MEIKINYNGDRVEEKLGNLRKLKRIEKLIISCEKNQFIDNKYIRYLPNTLKWIMIEDGDVDIKSLLRNETPLELPHLKGIKLMRKGNRDKIYFGEDRDEYCNNLNIETKLEHPTKVRHSFFSDQGAWFAYALPKEKEDYGSMIGPLLMRLSGRWIGEAFSKLVIIEEGKNLDLSKSQSVERQYFPGLIKQTIQLEGLKIVMQLIFIDKICAALNTSISTHNNKKRTLHVLFRGETMDEEDRISVLQDKRGISVDLKKDQMIFCIAFPDSKQSLRINANQNKYQIHLGKIELEPNQSHSILQIHSYWPEDFELSHLNQRYNQIQPVSDFQQQLNKNKKRWNSYLNKYFNREEICEKDHKNLAVKCIITLNTNWRCASGDLIHDGVFPSSSFDGKKKNIYLQPKTKHKKNKKKKDFMVFGVGTVGNNLLHYLYSIHRWQRITLDVCLIIKTRQGWWQIAFILTNLRIIGEIQNLPWHLGVWRMFMKTQEISSF